MTQPKEILSVAKRLHDKNWLAACDGNISCRISKNEILITPRGKPKAFLKASDLVKVKIDGKLPEKASSESIMHLEIYRSVPEAKAVVHAHPPCSIAWSIAKPKLKELPCDSISELILAVGHVPIVPFARPSTQAMGENLRPYLPGNRVMILARHGALSWGESLMESYLGIERLEHSAKILFYAEQLGGLSSLPASEVAWLREARAKIGDTTL